MAELRPGGRSPGRGSRPAALVKSRVAAGGGAPRAPAGRCSTRTGSPSCSTSRGGRHDAPGGPPAGRSCSPPCWRWRRSPSPRSPSSTSGGTWPPPSASWPPARVPDDGPVLVHRRGTAVDQPHVGHPAPVTVLWERWGRLVLIGQGGARGGHVRRGPGDDAPRGACIRWMAAAVTLLAAWAGGEFWHARPQTSRTCSSRSACLLREGWEARPRTLVLVPALMRPVGQPPRRLPHGLGVIGLVGLGDRAAAPRGPRAPAAPAGARSRLAAASARGHGAGQPAQSLRASGPSCSRSRWSTASRS